MQIRLFNRLGTALAALLLVPMLFSACSSPPQDDSEAITANIHAMADAVRERNARQVNRHISDDFGLSLSERDMTREDTRRMMTGIFMRHQNINVVLTNIQVEMDPGSSRRAIARFNALVTGGSGGILPSTAQLYRVESDWELTDGDWLLVGGRARRAME